MIARPGISAISYALPAVSRSVRELAAAGSLDSDADAARALRIRSRVRRDRGNAVRSGPRGRERPVERAGRRSTRRSARCCTAARPARSPSPSRATRSAARALCDARRFEFPATRLQFDLGLEHATVLGLDQLACTSILGAVRLARGSLHRGGASSACSAFRASSIRRRPDAKRSTTARRMPRAPCSWSEAARATGSSAASRSPRASTGAPPRCATKSWRRISPRPRT